jgi:hypothetical protein
LDGINGVIFQKIELFITTAVRTPNPKLRKEVSMNLYGSLKV